MKSTDPFSRRQMLAAGTAATTFTIVPRHVLGGAGYTAPSSKLNIAGIGVGGMGTGDVKSVAGENIVALCDVDQNALSKNAKLHPKAKLHTDLSQDAGDAEGHRRRRDRHARPHPRRDRDDGHQAGQACALSEAAHAFGV